MNNPCGMTDVQKAQKDVVDRFTEIDDPLYTYELLLDAAWHYCQLDESERTEDRKVRGCQSNAWLKLETHNGRIFIQGASDTLVIRGILALITEVFNGVPPKYIQDADFSYLERAGVLDTFDSSRRNGVSALLETIKNFAANL